MIGYLDCSTGVSGDKFLGALLDAGTSSGTFTAEDLKALVGSLAPEATVIVERVRSRGIAALGVRIEASEDPVHRHWSDVRALLKTASLPARVKERALATFAHIAEAEALAHGCAPDEVHFHEVGALDSIADIIGVCAGLEALGVHELVASTVAVGAGTVRAAHGVLPVPAPATATLIVGMPTFAGPAREDGSPVGELTTPTGAALLRTCVDRFGSWPAMQPRVIGYGAGTRDIGSPNVCRLVLGDPTPEPATLSHDVVTLLESNVDHLSPEAVSVAVEQLLGEGALDVWTSPIVMKKGRPAITLSMLTAAEDAERLASRLVALTGTLGVRRTEVDRLIAQREACELITPYGPVRFKIGPAGARPEADDVARIAREHGRPFADVARELVELFDEN